MAGLLAWAADVVGAHGNNHELSEDRIPIVFTEDQQKYVQELDSKASSLSRSIQGLRLRLPSPDISQRLPHILAHSLASNAALALQLNAHSATKEQRLRSMMRNCSGSVKLVVGLICMLKDTAQLRKVTLQEENAAYEKAILNCENKLQERMQETDLLLQKLQEMDETEQTLMEELENAETALDARQSGKSFESVVASEMTAEAGPDAEAEKSAILEKLDNKKKELSSMEEIVQDLEKRWVQVQENELKQPTPAQREKLLDKQLHSLMEQLAVKQAQAEGLVGEIHLKEMELERLKGLWRMIESSNVEGNTARNRFGRSTSEKGSASTDYMVDKLPCSTGGRTEHQQRLMLLRVRDKTI
nr:GRIP1-associated protein 1-like isoform X2 [Populus alba]